MKVDGKALLALCCTPPAKKKDRLFTSDVAKQFANLTEDGDCKPRAKFPKVVSHRNTY